MRLVGYGQQKLVPADYENVEAIEANEKVSRGKEKNKEWNTERKAKASHIQPFVSQARQSMEA